MMRGLSCHLVQSLAALMDRGRLVAGWWYQSAWGLKRWHEVMQGDEASGQKFQCLAVGAAGLQPQQLVAQKQAEEHPESGSNSIHS